MANRFKTQYLRETYDIYVGLFHAKKLLFNPDGVRNKGNAYRNAFWNGYDGLPNYTFPKNTAPYAAYRAGQDCAKL